MKKTLITIEIETDFKEQKDEYFEEATDDMEKEFHNLIFEYIENIIQSNDLENGVYEFARNREDYDFFPDKKEEFSELGEIKIKIRHNE